MSIIEAVRRYFHRRQAKPLIQQARRVNLVTQPQPATLGNFVFPGMDYVASIEVDGQAVGHIDYSINPLRDRIYISMIEVTEQHRRRGYGLGSLWQIWTEHQMPIVPLQQYGTSTRFWQRARVRFTAAGASIGEEIRTVEEWEKECLRWKHLVPEPTHKRLQRELMASPEWPAIKARWEKERGSWRQD